MIKFNLVIPKSERKYDELLENGRFNDVVKLCNKLCRKEPSAAHYYFLGMGNRGLGKYDDAIAAFEKAVECDRSVMLLYEQLYLTVLEKAGLAEVVAFFSEKLKKDPDNSLLYGFLFNALRERGTPGAFLGMLEQLHKEHPGLIEPLVATANYFHLNGKREKAEELLLKALGHDPEHPEVLGNLGNILRESGKLDAAAACMRMVLAKYPDRADVASQLSYVCYARKEYEESLEHLKPFINQGEDVAPQIVLMYLHISKKMGLERDAVRLADIFLRNNRSPFVSGDLQGIYAELAKICDARGDFDKAFHFMKIRNDNIGEKFDIKGHLKYCRQLTDAFSRQYFADLTVIPSSVNKQPIFIVGMPRSGTSLTEQILGQHSQVYPAGECVYMGRVVKRLSNPDVGGTPNLQELLTHLNSDPRGLEEARDYYYGLQEVEHKFSEPYFTDKMPQNFMNLGFIKTLFPNAKIIHCRRNALDTCVSCYFQSFNLRLSVTNDLRAMGEFYLEYERLMQHWRDVGIDMLEVDYENMVENQEQVTRQLLDYCGLPWEDACLDFHKSERFVPTASSEQVNKPIYTSSAGRWRHYEKHLKPLIDVIGVR